MEDNTNHQNLSIDFQMEMEMEMDTDFNYHDITDDYFDILINPVENAHEEYMAPEEHMEIEENKTVEPVTNNDDTIRSQQISAVQAELDQLNRYLQIVQLKNRKILDKLKWRVHYNLLKKHCNRKDNELTELLFELTENKAFELPNFNSEADICLDYFGI